MEPIVRKPNPYYDLIPYAQDYKTQRKRRRIQTTIERLIMFYKCPLCGKVFQVPSDRDDHMETHNTRRFACVACEGVAFDTYNELRAHRKESHSLEVHKCTECSFTSRRRFHVAQHIQKNHIDGIPCTVDGCTKRFAKNRLRIHIREAHFADLPATRPVRAQLTFEKCPKCEYRPEGSMSNLELRHDDLMRHILTKHEKSSKTRCPSGCGETMTLASIEAHLKTCSAAIPSGTTSEAPTNTMSSQISEETRRDEDFFSDVQLSDDEEEEQQPAAKRQKTSTLNDDFKCNVCQKTSKTREALRKHIWGVHRAEKASTRAKAFKCERPLAEGSAAQCGKTFRTVQALSDHYNVHDDVKPYGCLSCNQRFHARDRFAVHLSKYHRTSIKDLNANLQDFGLRPDNQKPSTSSAPQEGVLTSSTSELPRLPNPETTSSDNYLPPSNVEVDVPSSSSSPCEEAPPDESQDSEEDLKLFPSKPSKK